MIMMLIPQLQWYFFEQIYQFSFLMTAEIKCPPAGWGNCGSILCGLLRASFPERFFIHLRTQQLGHELTISPLFRSSSEAINARNRSWRESDATRYEK